MTERLAPGIVHERGWMKTYRGGRQVVHVGRVDLTRQDVRLRSLLSGDEVVGLATPRRIAEDHRTPRATPMLVTNGGMSRLGRAGALAAPHSLHVSGGELMVAQECARPTLGIDPSGRARMDLVRMRMRVDLGRRRVTHRRYLRIAGLNTDRKADEIILYTSRFGASTLTRPGGVEVILRAPARIRTRAAISASVVAIRYWGGDARIRPGQMILSGQGA